jgi:hypothetical protein
MPLEHLRRLRTLRGMPHQSVSATVIVSEVKRLELNRECVLIDGAAWSDPTVRRLDIRVVAGPRFRIGCGRRNRCSGRRGDCTRLRYSDPAVNW